MKEMKEEKNDNSKEENANNDNSKEENANNDKVLAGNVSISIKKGV